VSCEYWIADDFGEESDLGLWLNDQLLAIRSLRQFSFVKRNRILVKAVADCIADLRSQEESDLVVSQLSPVVVCDHEVAP